MDEPGGKEWNADVDDGDDIVLLVQQGLLPLSLRSILTARLVCKQWRKSIGCLLDHFALPFEVWSGITDNNSTSPQAVLQRQQRLQEHTGAAALQVSTTGTTGSLAEQAPNDTDLLESEEADGPAAAEDADDVWVPPFPFQGRRSKRLHSDSSLVSPQRKQQRRLRQDAPGPLEHNSDAEELQEQPLQQQQQQEEDEDMLDNMDAEQQPQQPMQPLQHQEAQEAKQEADRDEDFLAVKLDYQGKGEGQKQKQQCNILQDRHDEPQPSHGRGSNSVDAAIANSAAAAARAPDAAAAAAHTPDAATAHTPDAAAAVARAPAAAAAAHTPDTAAATTAAAAAAARTVDAAAAAAASAPAAACTTDPHISAVSGGTPVTVAAAAEPPPLAAAPDASNNLGNAVISHALRAAQAADRPSAQHPLQHLPASFPCATLVTLLCQHRSSSATERAAPAGDKLRKSLQILGQLPKLHTLVLQGSLPRPMWQPLLAGLQQGSAHQIQEQQQQQQTQERQQQQQQTQECQQQPTGAMQVDQQLQLLRPRVPYGLQDRLVCLKLVGCDLPTAEVLEGVVGLRALREFVLHASIKSPALQPDHLEALSTGTQLESLSLLVYQIGLGGSSRVQLNPLLELTNLRSLDIAYKGIFNDQRPQFRSHGDITALHRLTSFSTCGLASPIIPQPSLTALESYSAVGNNRRIGGRCLATISSCSSIRSLKLDAGRRGVAAVSAEHLHYIGTMKQLTSLSLSLSKGGQAASKSTQQLLQLQLPGLKVLSLGSGDHRIGISTEQFQQLAAQWPRLESLRLNSFSPLQGLVGFSAFSSLQSLSLKPGTGTGRLLDPSELRAALEPLRHLRRLHLDFRAALHRFHVSVVATACADRLQHFSLHMRGVKLSNRDDMKAIEHVARLTCLTSLQLMGTVPATFSGRLAAEALQSMQSLRWLSVQSVEDTLMQAPAALGAALAEGLQTLTQLRELRVWLGSGVGARDAQEDLARRVESMLHDCRVYSLQEPERAVM